MKLDLITIAFICFLMFLGLFVFVSASPEVKEEATSLVDKPSNLEKDSSPCVNTDRIACVPTGGSYHIYTKEVLDAEGNIVSTKAERESKWRG